MKVINEANLSNLADVDIPEADEYQHCNFAFASPVEKDGKKVGVHLFAGNTKNLKFHRCNMTNRIPPDNAVFTKCITPIIEQFDSVNIDGKEAEGFRLYGNTNQITKEAVYRKDVLDNFTIKKEETITYSEKVAGIGVPVLPVIIKEDT